MKAVRRSQGAWYFRPFALICLAALSALLVPAALAASPADPPAPPVRVIVALETPATLAAGDPQAEARAVDAAQDALARVLPARGARELDRASALPLMLVEIAEAKLAALEADPRVAAVELDRLSRPMLDVSAALIGAPTAWGSGHTGAGQTIVVLDTGVDLAHPALAGSVVDGACFSTSQRYDPPPQGTPEHAAWIDYSSDSLCPDGSQVTRQFGRAAGAACPGVVVGCDHGTHVAGIAAGRAANGEGAGVASGASVVSVQVYSRFRGRACGVVDTQASCALSWSSDQLAALDWVYANRAELDVAAVNMSLGDVSPLAAPCDARYPATKLAIDQLRAAGIPTIAAAGNAGWSSTLDPRMSAPACVSGALAVGATDLGDGIAAYSNSAPQLVLLAPGSDIRSSVPGGAYGARSGTSMAVPHVAGAWAVLRAARPDATFEQILDALARTGKPVSDRRNSLTRPRVQLDAALAALPEPPTVLAVSPARLSFGSHEVGTASPAQSLTLTNTGGTPLHFGAIVASGDFTRTGGTCPHADGDIQPGAACTVEVNFAPTHTGQRSGTLSLTGQSQGARLAVPLDGTGVAPQSAYAALSNTALAFDAQRLDASGEPRTLTITNIGGQALKLAGITVSGDFTLVGGTCPTAAGELAAGASCTVEVAFAPTASGKRTGTLTIQTRDGIRVTPVTLEGSALAPERRVFLPAVSGG